MQGCINSFPRDITLIAKVYNTLLLNCTQCEVKKILWENQNGSRRNQSTTLQILTVHWILKGSCLKNHKATLLFVNFPEAFDSLHRGKMKQIPPAYGLPKKLLPLWWCFTKTQMQWFVNSMVSTTFSSLLLESWKEIHSHHICL